MASEITNSSQPNNGTSSSSSTVPQKRMFDLKVEYDLSTIKDTKAGFLLDKISQETATTLSSQQQQQKKRIIYEHEIELKSCAECKSENVSMEYKLNFGVDVCVDCIKTREEYSLLTKTECKEDYLLADRELESLRYIEKPNPHRKFSRHNMKLFLRKQVEEYAFGEKYGSEEALDKEHDKRQLRRQQLHDRRYQRRLLDLRRRTLTDKLSKNDPTKQQSFHKHKFIKDAASGSEKCEDCGFEVEVEEL